MNLGEFSVRLGVAADTFTVNDFASAIGNIPAKVFGAISALTGLSYSFIETSKELGDMTSRLNIFAAQTGKSVFELQKWQQAAERVGISGDLMANTLTTLADVYGEASIGNINPKQLIALQQLGVSDISEDPEKMLKEILVGAKGWDPRTASALLKKAGVSPELLQLKPGDIKGLTPILTQQDIEAQKKVIDARARIHQLKERGTANIETAGIKIAPQIPSMLPFSKSIEVFNKAVEKFATNTRVLNVTRTVGENLPITKAARVVININSNDPHSTVGVVKKALEDIFTSVITQSNNSAVP